MEAIHAKKARVLDLQNGCGEAYEAANDVFISEIEAVLASDLVGGKGPISMLGISSYQSVRRFEIAVAAALEAQTQTESHPRSGGSPETDDLSGPSVTSEKGEQPERTPTAEEAKVIVVKSTVRHQESSRALVLRDILEAASFISYWSGKPPDSAQDTVQEVSLSKVDEISKVNVAETLFRDSTRLALQLRRLHEKFADEGHESNVVQDGESRSPRVSAFDERTMDAMSEYIDGHPEVLEVLPPPPKRFVKRRAE